MHSIPCGVDQLQVSLFVILLVGIFGWVSASLSIVYLSLKNSRQENYGFLSPVFLLLITPQNLPESGRGQIGEKWAREVAKQGTVERGC